MVLVAILSPWVVSCTAASTPPPTAAGEWKLWKSIDELAAAAELVVVGTVGEYVGHFEIKEPDGSVHKSDDVFNVLVDIVLRGEPTFVGRNIAVGIADFGTPDPNITSLEKGQQVVLFLGPFQFGGDGPLGWVPLSSDIGVYDLRGQVAVARSELAPEEMRSVTMEELSVATSVP
jgi:hypothetical protein